MKPSYYLIIDNKARATILNKSTSFFDVSIYGKIFKGDKKLSVEDIKDACSNNNSLNGFFALVNGDFLITIISNTHLYVITSAFSTFPVYFYKKEDQSFIFSSVIKGITCIIDDAQINWDKMAYKIQKQSLNVYSTIINDVFRLKGGRIFCQNLRNLKTNISNYLGSSLHRSAYQNFTENDFIAHYKECLTKAVVQRIEGKSEIIIPLSGGYDSSILYTIAKDYTNITAATICTTGGLINKEYDRALELTTHSDSTHVFLPVSFRDKANPNEWYKLICKTEQVNSGFEYFLKSQLMSALTNYTTADTYILSGTGSDQFSGGTSKTDYCIDGFHNDWNDFMKSLISSKWKKQQKQHFTHFFQFAINFLEPQQKQAVFPFNTKTIWEEYMENNRQFIDKSAAYFEAKLFPRFGYNVGFPFLDTKLLNLLYAIPPPLYPKLFFDKAIVQKAFGASLPNSFHNYKKFHPSKKVNGLIFQYLSNLIYKEKGHPSLLDIVFKASPALNEYFNKVKLDQFISATAKNGHYRSYTNLLNILNIGILDIHLIQHTTIDIPNNTPSVFHTTNHKEINIERMLLDDY